MKAQAPIRVLIVDDSLVIRTLLSELLNSDPDLQVVGTAEDAYDARQKIKQLRPHVITLDVEMPGMDGITFLKNLMRLRPMPVVMISSLTSHGAEVTMQALELGAIDFMPKPRVDEKALFSIYGHLVIDKVKAAARAEVGAARPMLAKGTGGLELPEVTLPLSSSRVQLIAFGASTGGTEAIKSVLTALKPPMPPMVIALHIPPVFSSSYAQRLNESCPFNVQEVSEPAVTLRPDHVYLAPGDRHLKVQAHNGNAVARLSDEAPVNRHKPSVEVLFNSVAEQMPRRALAIMLTGMGSDGARAMGLIRQAGGLTLVQDQMSSVVWGMPGAVVRQGGADQVVALSHLPRSIVEAVNCPSGVYPF